MFRYLALIAPSALDAIGSPAMDLVNRDGGAWEMALNTTIAKAWVQSCNGSSLGFRSLSGHEGYGCLIGRDFERFDAFDVPGQNQASDALLRDRWGAYVAIRVDEAKRCALILRDPTGRIPCWQAELATGGYIVFSHLSDARSFLGNTPVFDWEYLRFHLYSRCFHGRRTAYTGINEILPGDEAEFGPSGVLFRRKWKPEAVAANPFASVLEARRSLRNAAETSVVEWARRYQSISLDLSGGFDSAIVLGLLRKVADHRSTVGINFVIPHPEGDERQWARDAAELHEISLVEEDVGAAISKPPPRFSDSLLRPAVRTMSLGYDQIGVETASRLSAEAFFTGTGGDHIFHESVTTALTADYYRSCGTRGALSFAHSIAQLNRATIWQSLANLGRAISGVAKFDLRRAMPASDLILDNFEDDDRFYANLHPLLQELPLSTTPERTTQYLDLMELQTHYWRYGRADICEEVHPLFSQLMIEVALRTPMHWFVDGGERRGLAKAAFGDLIPRGIMERRSKSSNTSHWFQVFELHMRQFRDLLLGGELASRGLINVTEIENLLRPLKFIEEKHFSSLTNILSVEQWLQEPRVYEPLTLDPSIADIPMS